MATYGRQQAALVAMSIYSLNLGWASVDLYTDIDLIRTYEALLASKLPPLFECTEAPSRSGYAVFHHPAGSAFSVVIAEDQKSITIQDPSRMLNSGESLFYIAYTLLEAQLQERGFTTCHSACVYLNNKGILLLGKEGSGKTSAAVQLCKNYGAQLVSNNFSILGVLESQVVVNCGTKFLMLRHEAVRRNLPSLSFLFSGTQKDSWTDKRSVDPEELEIITHDSSTNIVRAYLLHVDNNKVDLHIEQADTIETRVYLNENFSRYIRATNLAILMGNNHEFACYLPSFDREEYFWQRVTLINRLLRDIQMKYVSGSLSAVTTWIAADVES